MPRSSSRKLGRGLSLIAALILFHSITAPPLWAQSGGPDAQYQTGFAYFQKRDYADACKYFQQAAAQGYVASKSMIQIVNGYGYHCAMPSANAAASANLPQLRQLYQSELAKARAWHHDAELTYAEASNETHPGYYTISFLFVSPSARETLSLVSSQRGELVGRIGAATKTLPVPSNFLDLATAVDHAHRAGMRGAIDKATLTVWQGKDGRRLAGWLLHAPQNRFETFLIGALDGRTYPVSQYTYPVEAHDEQTHAVHQTARQPAGHPAPSQSCRTALTGFCCGYGYRYYSAPSEGLKCPGTPCDVFVRNWTTGITGRHYAGRSCW